VTDSFLPGNLHQRRIIFGFALVAALWITVFMNIIGEPLVTPEAPAGIVSFELAGTSSKAQIILNSWNTRAKLFAAFGLGFDYLYMLAYSTAISLGCLFASSEIRERNWPFGLFGAPLALGIWLAAVFDAVENLALAFILLGGASSDIFPAIARVCALVKFGLILLGMVYVVYGLAVTLSRRRIS
jgi:hypothetical protein